MTEMVFLNMYGSPFLQALVGLGAGQTTTDRHIEHDLVRDANSVRLRSSWSTASMSGDVKAAVMLALIYIRLQEGSVDERSMAML